MIPRMTIGGEVDSSASLKPGVRYYRSPGHAASILAKREEEGRGEVCRGDVKRYRATPSSPFHGEFYASRLRNIYFFLLSLFLYFTHLSIPGLSNLFLEPRGE